MQIRNIAETVSRQCHYHVPLHIATASRHHHTSPAGNFFTPNIIQGQGQGPPSGPRPRPRINITDSTLLRSTPFKSTAV